MSDIIVLESRVGTLENDARDAKDKIDELDDTSDSHSDRLLALEVWKRGNGARGAEARLQDAETTMASLKECLREAQSDEAIAKIATAAARGIINNARERDKTFIEKIKAVAAVLNPILAAAALIVATVIAAS